MRGLRNLAIATVVTVFILMMLGGYVKAIHAGLACPTWPKCFDDMDGVGNWFPFMQEGIGEWDEPVEVLHGFTPHQVFAEWIHRFVAAYVVGPLMLWLLWASWRMKPVHAGIRNYATASVVLLPVQFVFGGLTVLKGLQPLIVTSHLGFATAIFGCLVAVAMLAHSELSLQRERERLGKGAATAAGASPALAVLGIAALAPPESVTATTQEHANAKPRARVADFVQILKPRILILLVFVGVTSMLVAAGAVGMTLDRAFLARVGWVLLGGTLAAGAANIFNNYIDRDIDAKMHRTKNRALPSQRMSPGVALAYGFLLTGASAALFGLLVNPMSAWLALGGIFFYAIVYTMWLKRWTAQNIVIGGAAGSFPSIVGWAAVDPTFTAVGTTFPLVTTLSTAALLGGIVFLWTPPHFWALALVYKEDYARGGVPMLPVVKGIPETKFQILVYTIVMVLASFLFYYPLGVLGLFYFTMALTLGLIFLAYAIQGYYTEGNKVQMSLFKYSILYLGLLYAVMVVDRIWLSGWTL